MTILYLLPVLLSALLLAAHFLRVGAMALLLLSLAAPLLLLVRRPWAPRIVQFLLIVAALEWMRRAANIVQERQAAGQPWMRSAIIIGGVALFTVASSAVFTIPRLRRRYLQ